MLNSRLYHMTQTAPRAISLENYNERSRVGAVLVEVRGPTKPRAKTLLDGTINTSSSDCGP